jgi:enoyl-CoA hydratase/carnithine racemase
MAKGLYEKRSRIGCITLNRPDRLNAPDDEPDSEIRTIRSANDEGDFRWKSIFGWQRS